MSTGPLLSCRRLGPQNHSPLPGGRRSTLAAPREMGRSDLMESWEPLEPAKPGAPGPGDGLSRYHSQERCFLAHHFTPREWPEQGHGEQRDTGQETAHRLPTFISLGSSGGLTEFTQLKEVPSCRLSVYNFRKNLTPALWFTHRRRGFCPPQEDPPDPCSTQTGSLI